MLRFRTHTNVQIPDRAPLHILISSSAVAAGTHKMYARTRNALQPTLTAIANCALLLLPSGGSTMTVGCALGLRAAVGASIALVYPPAMKLLGTWVDQNHRSQVLGSLLAAVCLAVALPQLIKAAVPVGWRTVVGVTSSVAMGGGGLAWRYLREGDFLQHSSKGQVDSIASGAAKLLRDRRFVLATLASSPFKFRTSS